MTGIYLPILLIGNPGMGKSTFINVIAGERISKATSSVEPVTSKAAYYDVKIPGKNEQIKEIKSTLLNEEDKREKTLKLLKFLKIKKAKILFIITRCHVSRVHLSMNF